MPEWESDCVPYQLQHAAFLPEQVTESSCPHHPLSRHTLHQFLHQEPQTVPRFEMQVPYVSDTDPKLTTYTSGFDMGGIQDPPPKKGEGGE